MERAAVTGVAATEEDAVDLEAATPVVDGTGEDVLDLEAAIPVGGGTEEAATGVEAAITPVTTEGIVSTEALPLTDGMARDFLGDSIIHLGTFTDPRMMNRTRCRPSIPILSP